MRTQITHALQKRFKVIQTAVTRYNELAARLGKPSVDWDRVSQYSFLEEFALLRETRQQILEQPWADPSKRLTMRQHRRRKRAQEELVRLNVEIHRLLTHIYDEEEEVLKKIDTLLRSETFGQTITITSIVSP